MNVLIIDYGMGNLGSLRRSLEECGAKVSISDNPNDLDNATHIVLPGVGAFADGMTHLRNHGFDTAIKTAVLDQRTPLLGICLGMQVLAEIGYEGGNVTGLGLIPGEVKRLKPNAPTDRVPHVGWNEVHKAKASPLLDSIPDKTDFYFVHSYHFLPAKQEHIIATTPYCGGFVSAIREGNIFGVQFHPEKSSRPGFQLLKNFLKI